MKAARWRANTFNYKRQDACAPRRLVKAALPARDVIDGITGNRKRIKINRGRVVLKARNVISNRKIDIMYQSCRFRPGYRPGLLSRFVLRFAFGCVAQTAELSSHKRKVGGSTPPTATNLGLVM